MGSRQSTTQEGTLTQRQVRGGASGAQFREHDKSDFARTLHPVANAPHTPHTPPHKEIKTRLTKKPEEEEKETDSPTRRADPKSTSLMSVL